MNITTIQEDGANIIKPTVKTTTYGLNSMKYKSANDWNKLEKIILQILISYHNRNVLLEKLCCIFKNFNV